MVWWEELHIHAASLRVRSKLVKASMIADGEVVDIRTEILRCLTDEMMCARMFMEFVGNSNQRKGWKSTVAKVSHASKRYMPNVPALFKRIQSIAGTRIHMIVRLVSFNIDSTCWIDYHSELLDDIL